MIKENKHMNHKIPKKLRTVLKLQFIALFITEKLLMLPLYPPLFQFQSVRSPFIVPITSQSPASLQVYTLFFIRKTNLTIVKHMIN